MRLGFEIPVCRWDCHRTNPEGGLQGGTRGWWAFPGAEWHLLGFAGFLGSLAILLLGATEGIGDEGSPGLAGLPQEEIALVAALEKTITAAIARAEKSVVAIYRVPRRKPGDPWGAEVRPDPFGRQVAPFAGPRAGDPEFLPSEYGTGVIVDPRGQVLTAYHVIGEDVENYEFFVTTVDRRTFAAVPYAADPRSDLAVLSFPGEGLQPITFGDASGVRKGQIVIALGNPYAIARDGQPSASWGIISNIQRKAPPRLTGGETTGRTTLHHFGTLIQTDARLNWGTSGGALINLKGEMIGLLTSLPAVAGYEAAAGYAYPVDETFRRVVETLKQGREVEYGFLGVSPVDLANEELLRGLRGARVDRIVPGTPAELCGLRAGDVVVAINGTPIYDADGLVLEVGRLPVDARIRVDFIRDGRPGQVEAVLTKYPVRGRKIVSTPAPSWRGLRVDYLSTAIESATGLFVASLPQHGGVVVAEVQPGTGAWRAGLRPGFTIVRVEGTSVSNPRDFFQAVSQATGPVRLTVRDRPGGPLSQVTVEPD